MEIGSLHIHNIAYFPPYLGHWAAGAWARTVRHVRKKTRLCTTRQLGDPVTLHLEYFIHQNLNRQLRKLF